MPQYPGVDEVPVPRNDKKWNRRLSKMRPTMGVSAMSQVVQAFAPESKHVAEEAKRQREGRVELPSGDLGDRSAFSGTVKLARGSRRGDDGR